MRKRLIYINKLVCLALLIIPGRAAFARDTTYVTNEKPVLLSHDQISIFNDITNRISFDKIRTIGAFHHPRLAIPNLGVSDGTVWLKFTLFNETNQPKLLINLKRTDLDRVRLYYPLDHNRRYTYAGSGCLAPISTHKYRNPNNIFEVPVPPYSARTFYLRIRSIGQIITPVYVGTTDNILTHINREELVFGLYLGIVLIMLFYNFFIYFTVKDKSYLYYIGFIFFVGFAQFCQKGYGYAFIWSGLSYITLQSINWAYALSGIATAVFLRVFLHTKEKAPVFDKALLGFIIFYILTILFTLAGLYNTSYILIDVLSFTGSLACLALGVKLAMEGFRPGKFFLVAWSFFIISIIIYVIKDFGLLPYNFFTSNVLLIGSSLEIALLSFALADKINAITKEKEVLQARALKASWEKQQSVKEQNRVLESKIAERTRKLQEANTELNNALTDLKGAQSQLVDAEKMATLGQLTAGIAHEINNPINFVKSNVKPLQLDIDDIRKLIEKYEELNAWNIRDELPKIKTFREKIEFNYLLQEIKTLLEGIEYGANRTADIVRGLRTFSRLDESELKEADLHEGIDTTIMLLTHNIPKNVSIIKKYDAVPGIIECYPGKINQVFMNIIMNGIQAVAAKPGKKEETVTISTARQDNNMVIRIADTGPGIPDKIREKIFDPFFTTKEVGEGTGLGLSIVFSIIENHRGTIEVRTEEDKGTEFIITLPVKQLKTGKPATPDREFLPDPQKKKLI